MSDNENQMNEASSGEPTDMAALRHENRELLSQLERKTLALRKAESDKADLLQRMDAINNVLVAMGSLRSYQLSNLLRRFSHEVVRGNRAKRKAFLKWLVKKMLKRPGVSANPYNLLDQMFKENVALMARQGQSDSQFVKFRFKAIDYQKLSDFEKRLFDDLSELLSVYPDHYVILYPTAIDWHIELFQRPQHLTRYVAESGYLTLFLTCNHIDRIDTVQATAPNCYIVNANSHIELVVNLLNFFGKKIILKIDSTDNFHGLDFVRTYEDAVFRIVYDYIDEIHEMISGRPIPQSTWDRHRYLLNDRQAVVIASADRLIQEVRDVRGDVNCALITNGADVDHFRARQGDGAVPSVIRGIVQKNKPIIGYFGALADWFDFELIRNAALQKPEYEFVLIGPVLNMTLDKSQFSAIRNLHFLGSVDYRVLPGVGRFFDVATIPFKVNEITLSTSPIKLFEYMAMAKPIVTTDLPECRKYKSVLIAGDAADYVRKLDEALQLAGNEDYLRTLREEADANSWRQKANDLLKAVNRSIRPRMPILFFSIIDWSFRHQRPQHLATQLAGHGHPVYFINANFKEARQIEEIGRNLHVMTLKGHAQMNVHVLDDAAEVQLIDQDLNEALAGLKIAEALIIVEYPTWEPIVSNLRKTYGFRIVLDFLDEFEGFSQTNRNRHLASASAALLGASDLVVATSSYLHDKALSVNPNSVLIRNGTEFSHFNRAAELADTDVQTVEARKPVIGYYGAIADWFDDRLVAEVADMLPDYDFVLIGDYAHGHVTELRKRRNVSLIGEMPYRQLPEHLATFDVCLIPFNAGLDLIKATNPVKFYEYLSAGKKVVATKIPELAAFENEYVLMANDAGSFARMIVDCVEGRDSLRPAADRIAFAKSQDWTERARCMRLAVDGLYPKVSIIIVTYNNVAYTKLCLDSIINKTSYPDYEIIVVDNHSSDETVPYLKTMASIHDNIRIILNEENTGFAKANNMGMAQARGESIVLLNNDTIVTPGWLSILLKHLSSGNIGMVGPTTNNIANEAKIAVTYEDVRDIDAFAYDLMRKNLNSSFDIKVLAMYCVMFRKALVEEIGMLDERFGIGMFEDDDFSDRIRKAGLRVVCCRDAFIHHFGGVTFKLLGLEQYNQLFEQNKSIYEEKHQKKFARHQTLE